MVKSKMSLTYKFLTAINSYFVVIFSSVQLSLKKARQMSEYVISWSDGWASVTDTLLHL